ncbi:MAG: LuxR C-terminal-related transcriptional regulator [Gaiellaceae bacterium]
MSGLLDLDCSLLDWLPLTVSVHDRSGRFVYVNEAFRRLPGLKDGVVLGYPLLAFIPEPVRSRAKGVIADSLAHGTTAQLSVVFEDPRTESRRFAVTVTIVPLSHGGQTEGFLAIGTRDGDPETVLTEAAEAVELTRRQGEILALLVKGRSTRDIARALFITPNAVRNHVHHIISLLGVETRAEAVEAARRRGLAPPQAVRYEDVPPLQ